jgi:hypothetical protein
MRGITYNLKVITPPDTLEHKNRKDEILELTKYLMVETDTGDNITTIYISPYAPGITDTDKIWFKTDYSDNKAPGLYLYEDNDWVLKVTTSVVIGDTVPDKSAPNCIWINTTDSTSSAYTKGIYYYTDSGWILLANLWLSIYPGNTPPTVNGIWLNTDPKVSGGGTDVGANLLCATTGFDVAGNWKNAIINPYNRGIYFSANPPSDAFLIRNFTDIKGNIYYPLWCNVGMSSSHPESLFRRLDTAAYWESIFDITLSKTYVDISVPAAAGEITLNYDGDTDYFSETPKLLSQLMNDNEEASLRWAVRPKPGAEKKSFSCLYYSAGSSGRKVDVLLVGLGKIRIAKVD